MKRQTLLKSILCLLMTLVCGVAWAQSFVMPETGKYYKLKGDNTQYPWLTGTLKGNSIVVSANEDDAAVFEKTENGLKVLTTGKYLGLNGSTVSLVDAEGTVTIGDHNNGANKYSVKVGNTFMYNNNADGITHESTQWSTSYVPYWGFIEVEITNPETQALTYTLTDNAGNTYEGSYQGIAGISVPTFTGAAGYTLTGHAWEGNKFTADITFPFTVSSAEVTNPTMIVNGSWSGNPKKWRAVVDGGENYVKVHTATSNATEINDWLWAVYPSLADDKFTYTIKSISTGLYVNANPSSGSDPQGNGKPMRLTSEATSFTYTNRTGSYYQFGYKNAQDAQLYISINGSSSDNVFLGVYDGSHQGNDVSFLNPIENTNFGFPVSTADNEQGVFISPFNKGFKYYVSGTDVKATTTAPDANTITNYVWAIYPTLGENGFTFKIKHGGTGNYIYTTSTSNQHAQGVVTVGETATEFTLESGNRFKSSGAYLSTNSTSYADQFAGTWTSAHNGTGNTIYTAIDENTYTLTDAVGNEYTGTYRGYVGISEPTFTGVEYTITEKVWNDNQLTAKIEFTGLPFPISKPGEEDWTFIRSYQMTDGKCYFHVNDAYTKVITRSPIAANGMTYLPTADKIAKWQWAIYPAIESGKIVFTIKNRAADEFVGGTGAANSMPLAETGSKFGWGTCVGNGKGFYLANSTNVFFAANSSGAGDKDAILWNKNSNHQGGNLEFFATSYTVTTDATGYTTLYTPIAVDIPNGVAAYTGRLNAANTLLSLDKVSETIPANTAVLLIGAASTTYTFVESSATVADIEGNVFQGSETSVDATSIDGSAYTYQSIDGDVAFAKVAEGAIPGYTAYIAAQSEVEVITTDIFKEAAKMGITEYTAKLKNQPGYYYCTIGGTKIYSAEEVNALIDATETKAAATEIVEAVKVQTLILPEAGKYYRIAYDYGNNGGVKYLQSTYHSGSNLALTDNKDESSLFYVEQVGENLRLKSYTTGKYIKEDGTTRGLHDVGGNVTFSAGSNTGKIKIQATSYLHASGGNNACYIDHCGSDGCAQHNFIVEEVGAYTLTVNAEERERASATWNGVTKTLPATWAFFEGFAITDPTLTIHSNASYNFDGLYEDETEVEFPLEITTLEANRNFTAKFSPAFFSKSTKTEDLVPVRIRNVRNNDYTIRLNTSNNGYTGQAINSGVTAYGENEIWYLVGHEESFKIYHRIAGTGLYIVLEGTGENSAASMGDTDTNADFCLQPSGAGYTICPTGNKGQSFNMNGGAGKDIKLYKTSDGGSNWAIGKMDVTNTLTLNVNVDQVWTSSPRVAELTFTIDDLAVQTRILGNVAGQKLYIPAGATYEVSSMTYRGYTYNGYTNVDGVITVSYTANDERTLFYSPRDGHPYRIPAIATAPNGDIFAICDYRPCGNDIGYGEVDLVCRMSSDNGVTWTEEKMIADGKGDDYAANDTSKIWQVGFGDPAIVADRESNKILVMSVCGNQTCWDGTFGETNPNPNRVARLYITYNEDTEKWEYGKPEEVTYSIYPKFVDKAGNVHAASLFIGAGKICQSRVVKKKDYYRLYCAVWNVTKTQRQHHNYVIYSDDFGQTWEVLGDLGYENSPAPAGNEPKCEELPDGSVVISSRVGGGRFFNIFTFNNDGKYTTGSWGTVAKSTETYDGSSQGTNGEIYKVKAIRKSDGKICDVMLQSVPFGPGRSNVKVHYKEMDYTTPYTPATLATGWAEGKHVSTKESCYSTMILQADGRIGFFFEEVPGGYCMVYIPYTLEDLTAGQYSLYTVTSTITDIEIGTFYASEAMQIPEGVKAFVADSDPEGDLITMTKITDGIIPARTGVVLRGAADEYKFIPSISYGKPFERNLLVGHEAANSKDTDENRLSVNLSEANGDIYVLATDDAGNAQFYKKEEDFTVKNNKAYLKVPQAMYAKGLRVRFAGEQGDNQDEDENLDGDTTEVETPIANDQQPTDIYDLQGRRVLNPTKGMYIIDGKKVVIK